MSIKFLNFSKITVTVFKAKISIATILKSKYKAKVITNQTLSHINEVIFSGESRMNFYLGQNDKTLVIYI